MTGSSRRKEKMKVEEKVKELLKEEYEYLKSQVTTYGELRKKIKDELFTGGELGAEFRTIKKREFERLLEADTNNVLLTKPLK